MNANYSEALEQQAALIRTYANSASHQDWEIWSVRQLQYAYPFYISDSIARFVLQAGDSLPGGQLDRSHLPADHGFVLLEREVFVSARDAIGLDIAAISWSMCRFGTKSEGYGDETRFKRDSDGIAVNIYFRGVTDHLLTVGYQTTWRWGASLDTTELAPIGQRPSWNEVDENLINRFRRFLFALFLFIEQRIFYTAEHTVERHARKRLERQGWNQIPLIRVVELRRKERVGSKHAVEPIEHEWSCQWVVRGHWRQQPYPKAGDVRPKWITPYVKGPESKPLKPPRTTVFAVVR